MEDKPMKFEKNRTTTEKEAVTNKVIAGTTEKMKCIKNTKTNKVQRVKKSVAEDIIKNDDNWHFTTKSTYDRILKGEEPKGATIQPYSNYKPKGKPNKGQFKDKKERQVIVKEVLNPDYDLKNEGNNITPILTKPKEVTTLESSYLKEESGRGVELPITVKAPGKPEDAKVIGWKRIPKFIKEVKVVVHLLVHGKRTSQLLK